MIYERIPIPKDYDLRLTEEEEQTDYRRLRIDMARDFRDLWKQVSADLRAFLETLLDAASKRVEKLSSALEYSRKMLLILLEPEMPSKRRLDTSQENTILRRN